MHVHGAAVGAAASGWDGSPLLLRHSLSVRRAFYDSTVASSRPPLPILACVPVILTCARVFVFFTIGQSTRLQ